MSRRAALGAAAVLVGPVASPGTVDLRTEFAATAVLRIAEMFLPWLEGVPAEAKSGTEGKRDAGRLTGGHDPQRRLAGG